MIRKNLSNHGRQYIFKKRLLSFDEFFRHACNCVTLVKFVKITTVLKQPWPARQSLLNESWTIVLTLFSQVVISWRRKKKYMRAACQLILFRQAREGIGHTVCSKLYLAYLLTNFKIGSTWLTQIDSQMETKTVVFIYLSTYLSQKQMANLLNTALCPKEYCIAGRPAMGTRT